MNTITYTNHLSSQEYNQLRESVGWYRLSERQATQGLENTTFSICARDKRKAIAMGRVLFDYGYTAYIGDIIVLPEYQHQGIGSYIVKELVNQVMNAADPEDKIMFFLGASKGKEAFYEKLGFSATPNSEAGSGMRMTITKQ